MADLQNSNKRKSTHDSNQDKKKTKSDFSSSNSASVQDCHAIIENLIENIFQAKVTIELGPYIFAAVQSNDSTKVQHLIEQGADVNTKSSLGTSLLHWAVFKKSLEVVKILIQGGANIRARNSHDQTPLVLAVCFKDNTMMDLLLENGATL